MAFEMPDMPAAFGSAIAAAEKEGGDPSIVDQVIGDVLATAGVSDPAASTPGEGGEPAGEPPAPPATPIPAESTPDAGGEEAPGDTPPAVPDGPPGDGAGEPDPGAPPDPPGGPLFPEPGQPGGDGSPAEPAGPGPDVVSLPDGRTVPAATVAALLELDRRVAADPQLREGLAQLLGRQQVPPPSPTFPAPAGPAPQIPQLSEEDLESPGIQALILVASRQQQELARLAETVNAAHQHQTVREQREHAEIVNGAVSAFQRTHNLPDDLMGQIRTAASRSNAMELYMAGTDPRTGTAVAPDPYRAVEAALELGYWQVPAARQFEFQRQSTTHAAAQDRKRRLAGIGGTSGSGPRTPAPPDLSTEDGRRAAAMAELNAAFYGAEEGAQ